MKQKNKIVKTSSTLTFYFVLYSFLAIMVVAATYYLHNNLFANYVLPDVKSYFAESNRNREFPAINEEKIIAAGGWVIVLDEQGQIIRRSDLAPIENFDLQDLTDLTNGDYSYNGTFYFGSLASFAQESDTRIVVAALPSNEASASFITQNLSETDALSFMVVFFIAVTFFVLGYILITVLMAKRLNNKIVRPILAITQALEQLKSEEYNISLDFKAKNEFVFIKNAFDLMLQRLSDAEIQRKERQHEKMKMLSDVGHDLRTPVTTINGLLLAILSGKVSDEKTRHKYIETIYKNTKVLLELIEMQLDYTLWERDGYKMVMTEQNLSECIRDVVITNLALCDEEDIELDIDIPDDDISYCMDSGQLRRAFSNLLSNAIFHNSDIPNIKIGVHLRKKSSEIQVFIADSGIPLSDDVRKALSSPTPIKERPNKDAGHGLGLSITQRIVEMHEGSLTLQEQWEGYTKAFVITLPLANT